MVLARRGLVSWPWILFLDQICACHDHKGRGVQIPQEDSVLPLGFSPQCFPLRPSTASAILCPDWSTHQHVSRWIEHWITWYAPFALHRGRNSSRSLGSRATMRSRWHCVESIRYHSGVEQVSHPGHRQSFQEVFSESRGQGKWKIKLLSVPTGSLRARCLKVKGKGVLGASETQRAREEEGKKGLLRRLQCPWPRGHVHASWGEISQICGWL